MVVSIGMAPSKYSKGLRSQYANGVGGLVVGTSVGACDGASVGGLVGVAVGAFVGWSDGTGVGSSVRDGANDGLSVATAQAVASWQVVCWAGQLPGHRFGGASCPVLDRHRNVTVWVPEPQFCGAVQAVVPDWTQP